MKESSNFNDDDKQRPSLLSNLSTPTRETLPFGTKEHDFLHLIGNKRSPLNSTNGWYEYKHSRCGQISLMSEHAEQEHVLVPFTENCPSHKGVIVEVFRKQSSVNW